MTTTKIIQSSIAYIEDHIQEPLDAELIATEAGYSIYYFHRLFSAYTGYSLVAYIRHRKMLHAKMDLVQGHRLIDIAMTYGYSSERAFSRAFLGHYGLSPSRCRHDQATLPEPLMVVDLTIDKTIGGITMTYLSQVSYRQIETMTVASHTIISQNPEEEVIAYMQQWMHAHHIPLSTQQYGFDAPVSNEQEKNGLRGYEYWVQLDKAIDDQRVICKDIPGYTYASLRIEDPFEQPFEKIPAGWKALVKWIEDNDLMKKVLQSPCLEQVIEENGITYMDIFIPIER